MAKKERKGDFKEYLFWAFIIALIIISYFILKEFLVVIISSFILAFFVLPLHKFISKKTGNKLSALISLSIVLIISLLIGTYIVTTLISQFSVIISEGSINQLSQEISEFIGGIEFLAPFSETIYSSIEDLGNSAVKIIYTSLTQIPRLALNLFLTFFISYFIIIDWKKIKKQIIKAIPFKNKNKLVKRVSETSKQIVYGALITSLLAFIVSLIGYYIAGIRFYAFFAFVSALFTFIPIAGAVIVWLPLTIIQLFQGNIIAAIIVLITGLIISNLIDYFFRIWVTGKRARLHPIIVILGIFGGIPLFGIAGFIVGPLILSITIEILKTNLEINN